MRIKPPTIRSVAGNFQSKKSTFRNRESTTALNGIPITVPRDMNSGNVYTIPKLILKLNMTLSSALMHR